MKPDFAVLRDNLWTSDGAWATELRARDWPVDTAVELANVRKPEIVSALADEYLVAGARFLSTNTFSANRLMLQRRHVEGDAAELNQRGAALARAAVDAFGAAKSGLPAFVIGVIGPSGRIMTVREAQEGDLRGNFAESARALAASGVDAILLETFSELAELLVALDECKRVTGLPVIASLSFDSGPQRTRTLMGADAATCATALSDRGADVIGSNCGGGIADALPAVVALRAHTSLPLWVKPNAGLPELDDGRLVYRQTAEEFAAFVPQLVDAGANIIGGCCGTGPAHVRRVAEALAPRGRAEPRPHAKGRVTR